MSQIDVALRTGGNPRPERRFAAPVRIRQATAPERRAAPVEPVRRVGPLRARLAGPGGCYNVGNAVGLLGGVVLAVVAAAGATGPTLGGAADAAFVYFAGSASALSVTLAMLIFFWSGEAYHRAWGGRTVPDGRLNGRGHLLSGFGALLLGVGLCLIGEPVLAASAGGLHAIGKFGSAFALHGRSDACRAWSDTFRATVLLSRLPALMLVLIEIAAALASPGGLAPAAIAAPGLLLVCYLLWAKGDLILLRGAA